MSPWPVALGVTQKTFYKVIEASRANQIERAFLGGFQDKGRVVALIASTHDRGW